MPPNEVLYVVLQNLKDEKHYSTEVLGGESYQMAARRLIVYHELDGPTQFTVHTALADSCGRAIDVVKRGKRPQITVKDVNGVSETFTRYNWQYCGMLYYNGAPN